ncbi:MAG: polyprenyl synthetase family protein [Alphaproteobacteria bacterium]
MGPVEAVAKGADFNPVERLAALLGDDMRAAESLIHERMLSEVALVPKLATHLVDSGGKRLRPLITLAAARQCGYAGVAHHKLAAAVEFIHTATLLHDDVVDESALRRGRAAANTVWGNKPSVLVGDFLFARAFQLMVETESLVVLDILANASAVIAEGEVMQLRASKNLATSEKDYLAVITAKTAALFAAAAESGSVLGEAGASARRALRDYGHNLGIAFQLVDDALDYSGRQAVMGKAVGGDFRECKVTLPIILSLGRSEEVERRFWRKTIEVGAQEDGDLARAIEYLERGGALAGTMERARAFAAQARDSLAPLPESDIRNALADIADFVVERAY